MLACNAVRFWDRAVRFWDRAVLVSLLLVAVATGALAFTPVMPTAVALIAVFCAPLGMFSLIFSAVQHDAARKRVRRFKEA